MWRSVPPCIFWAVWKERNRIAFRDGTVDVHKLKHSFIYNLWSCVKDGGSNCQRWKLQLSKMEASNMEASNCQ